MLTIMSSLMGRSSRISPLSSSSFVLIFLSLNLRDPLCIFAGERAACLGIDAREPFGISIEATLLLVLA